jgi:hypothetical protein
VAYAVLQMRDMSIYTHDLHAKHFLLAAGILGFASTTAAARAARPPPSGGPARHGPVIGDDYPAAWKRAGKDAFATVFGLNRECVSFAAWKVYIDTGGRQVPRGAAPPADWARYSINVGAAWGNAGNWGAHGASHGVRVDQNPTAGSIAHWNVHTAIGMKLGHVGVVKAVNRDGSVDIEQYNLREDGRYSVLHMARRRSAIDRSNGHGAWLVPWPDDFIHIHNR